MPYLPSNPPRKLARVLRRPARCAALVLAALAVGSAGGWAQSPLPAGSPGRFTMQPADGGILRMDTQTGALSMCRQASGSWSCTMLPDDRTAMNTEIERLKSENIELKSAVRRLEDLAGIPGNAPPDAGPGKRQSGVQLPTEEEVDKAMSYVQRMIKKFKEKIKELEDDEPRKGTNL